jgi:hypothetical protein
METQRKTNIRRGCIRLILLGILVIGGIYYGSKMFFTKLFPTYTATYNSFNPYITRLNDMKLAFDGDKPYLWLFTEYDRDGTYDYYYLDIIDPTVPKRLSSTYFKESGRFVSSSDIHDFENIQNKYFFTASKLFGIQGRKIATGEVILTEKDLIKKHQELKAGIGEIKKNSNENWYELTTKDGLKYMLSMEDETVVPADSFEVYRQNFWQRNVDTTSKEVTLEYVWALTQKDSRRQLYQVKQYKSIYEGRVYPREIKDLQEKANREQEEGKVNKENRTRNEEYYKRLSKEVLEQYAQRDKEYAERDRRQKLQEQTLLMTLKDKVFLNGQLLYGNKEICLVLHNTEVSKEAANILTCINHEGKILWEIKSPALKSLQDLKTENVYQVKTYLHKDTFIILNNNAQKQSVVALNIKTGKKVWEFLPLQQRM